ncbi:MAG: GGDEF domain-containing protein [Lachnospiraceae bacterium]|nr:GGDEF domain-containing protein [Lachnospiraceae bacterium]
MLQKIKNICLYGGTDKETYNLIRRKIEKTNARTVMIYSSVAFVLVCIMFVMSFVLEGFASSRSIFVSGMLCSLALIIISLYSEKIRILSYIAIYFSFTIFLLYGIAIAVYSRPEQQAATFLVMLVLLPMIFVDKPLRIISCLGFYVIVFLILVLRTKTGSVLYSDLTNAVIYGLLSAACSTIVIMNRINGFVLEYKLQKMSEIDQLTGLNNRNCYEWRLNDYKGRAKDRICCIYIDGNGLHQLNNTEGHEKGDLMLKTIADELKNAFGMYDSYRIGGDEFVAFTLDMLEETVAGKIANLIKNVEDKGFHMAVGYEMAETKDIDMNNLVVSAETKMYKNKSEFYKLHDRRRR